MRGPNDAALGCNGCTRTGRVDALGERERLLQQPSARTERVRDECESLGALNGIPHGTVAHTAGYPTHKWHPARRVIPQGSDKAGTMW